MRKSKAACHVPTKVSLVIATVLLALASTPARAQESSNRGRLTVTVMDPSGAVIPGASVKLLGLEDETKKTDVPEISTTARGVATLENLSPGRYRLRVEFAAFTGAAREIQIRRGDNKMSVTLDVAAIAEDVVVGRDVATVDPLGGRFLTREEIAALPDNPREMMAELIQLIGRPNIYIDGFFGGAPPSKAQIKSIHITRDAFSAENHFPGSRADIVTKVSDGPMAGGLYVAADSHTGQAYGRARFEGQPGPQRGWKSTPFAQGIGKIPSTSPFATSVAASRDYWGSGDLSGAFVKGRSSFSLNFYNERSYQTPLINAMSPAGHFADVSGFQQRYDEDSVGAMVDYALSPGHTLRGAYSFWNETDTGGVGGYELIARGWTYTDRSHMVRFLENGPIGTRGFINSRLQVEWEREANKSDNEATTVRVLDAFTDGGAQLGGDLKSAHVTLGSDIDYARGIHAVRGGFNVFTTHNTSAWNRNYLGTYTYESLDALNGGRPRSFTRAVGDPTIDYRHLEAGVYIQDDIRIRKNLILSPGLRYEAQMHVPDRSNWAPRFGFNWAPGPAGRTAIRASWGIFYDWMAVASYERAVRFDGTHQQEINIADPGLSVSPSAGPSNIYRLSPNLHMASVTRLVTSVTQRITRNVTATGGYTRSSGADQWRGQNLNALVNGVRPNPALANVIEAVSDARSLQHQFNTNININLANAAVPAAAGARGKSLDWRRSQITVIYNFNQARTNTEGPFVPSPTGTLDTEWGAVVLPNPDNIDLRHSGRVNIESTMVRNLRLQFSVARSVGAAYSIRTGVDTNGDLIFNDRPDGVGRYTAREASRVTLVAQVNYRIQRGTGAGQRPYAIELFGGVDNLGNRYNYTRSSGVMTSPFFQSPTAVLNPMGVRFRVMITY